MEPSFVIRSEPCPRCRARGEDNSGDNLKVYSNGGKYCFSCNAAIEQSDDYKLKNKKIISEIDFPVTDYTQEQWLEDKKNYTTDPHGFRGLKKATCDAYQVQHELVEIDNQAVVTRQYYPISKEYQFAGVKVRIVHPEKDFRAKGYCKADCDLFGQAIFKASTSRFVVIASGELDALSAYQMLNDPAFRKTDDSGNYLFPDIPVVSGTAGEASSLKQYKNNYEFLDRFEMIYIIPDKDDKGEEALHKVAQALPKDKLKVIDLPAKDANKMLEDGRSKDFLNAFWKAKFYSPAGIIGSDQLYEKMLEKAYTQKIEFPPDFLQTLNDVTGGGMTLGSIVNITGGCYPSDTEFFNGSVWKPISQYDEKTDLLLQYDALTGNSFLAKPVAYVKLPVDQFYTIKNTHVDFTTSAIHKHLVKTEKGVVKTMTTLELLQKHNEKKRGNKVSLVNTFLYEGSGIAIDPNYIRLKIAVFADGSFKKDSDSSDVRINLKKERKKVRLRQLLSDCQLPYKESVKEDGYSIFTFKMDNRDKHFPSEWYNFSKEQFEIVKDEVVRWDGSLQNRSLSKADADFVQFTLTSIGLSTTVYKDARDKYNDICYAVSINNSVGLGISKDTNKASTTTISPVTESESMYCFTTKSGFFPVRQKGAIFVSGNSGSGKSTLANDIVKYHIIKKTYGVGVISLESDAGDYAENLISSYIQEKLHWIKDPAEKVKYLQSDAIKKAAKELFLKEDGTPSFHMIDERGDYQNLQAKIEELIISCDVQIILIDVLSDVFDGESMEFQSKWMSWEKATVKRYPVTFINVVHTRKVGGGQKSASTGGVMTEEDISGSSTQYKSASLNLIISRNKVAEEELLRNMMTINLFKNRQTGWTGEVGNLMYDPKRHSFKDMKDWFQENPTCIQELGLDPLDPIKSLKENEANKDKPKHSSFEKEDKAINRY